MGGGGERGERQALIQNMAKRLSMHGKLLLSEVPIYRVSTLRNCFCEPSPSPIPAASLPGWAGRGEATEKCPCSRVPPLWLGGEAEGWRLQDCCPRGGA